MKGSLALKILKEESDCLQIFLQESAEHLDFLEGLDISRVRDLIDSRMKAIQELEWILKVLDSYASGLEEKKNRFVSRQVEAEIEDVRKYIDTLSSVVVHLDDKARNTFGFA